MKEFVQFVVDELRKFFKEHPSLSLILLSLLLTAIWVEPSLASMFEHAINAAILFAMWGAAKTRNHVAPPICIFASVILSAIMMRVSEPAVICQMINLILLLGAWYVANKEASV